VERRERQPLLLRGRRARPLPDVIEPHRQPLEGRPSRHGRLHAQILKKKKTFEKTTRNSPDCRATCSSQEKDQVRARLQRRRGSGRRATRARCDTVMHETADEEEK
jgi:hypothetical protein